MAYRLLCHYSFTVLETLYVLSYLLFLQLLPPMGFFIVSFRLFFGLSTGSGLVAFLDCRVSLGNVHFRFLHVLVTIGSHCWVPKRLSSLTCWRTSWLLSSLDNDEWSQHNCFVYRHEFSVRLRKDHVIIGSCDKSMHCFVRNNQPVFQSGCSILHSLRPRVRGPVALYVCGGVFVWTV